MDVFFRPAFGWHWPSSSAVLGGCLLLAAGIIGGVSLATGEGDEQ